MTPSNTPIKIYGDLSEHESDTAAIELDIQQLLRQLLATEEKVERQAEVLSASEGSTTARHGRLFRQGLRLLPAHARDRWFEEWCAELSQLDSRCARAWFIAALLLAMPRLAWILRRGTWRRDRR